MSRTGIRIDLVLLLVLAAAGAQAQDLEPRAFTNAPVGLNFLIAGYGYADGALAFDPALPISDANFHTNTGFVAYARSLGVAGRSAKFDIVVPYTSFVAHGLVAGEPRERAMTGFNDPRFRFSINFHGAPALEMKEFASYRQDLIIGASLLVTAPLGQYDNTKLLNLSNNRWGFTAQLGISKAWGPWTVEVAPGVTVFTDNTDFNNGGRFEQAPFYSLQAHLVYGFSSGMWVAANGTWYSGGRTTVNGVKSNNLQANTRIGLTLALPVDRNNSVKIHAGAGTSTRTGTEFDGIGIAWQYRWGAGL